jgi:hypothetical protein
MEAMRAAFYRVCGDVLQLSCDVEDPLTEVVVAKIVELAKAGERDPDILCGKVLTDLATSSTRERCEAGLSRRARHGRRAKAAGRLSDSFPARQSHHISRENAPLSRKVKVVRVNIRPQRGRDGGPLTFRRVCEAMPYPLW